MNRRAFGFQTVCLDVVRVMRERVLAAARSVGRAPEEITCIYNLEVRIGERDPRPDVVSGSPNEVAEMLSV